MRAKFRHGLCFLIVVCLLKPAPAHAEQFAVGRAYAVGSSSPLYTEEHRWDEHHDSVRYRWPDGRIFATTDVDFSHSFISPAYILKYLATGMDSGARWAGSKLILFHDRREATVDYAKPLVINAGFLFFVRAHWDDLLSGKTAGFDFAVPNRLTTVTLQVRRVSAAESDIIGGDPTWHYFQVEAASPMLRAVMKPLSFAFDARRRLMVFRGASNVKVENGETPQVLIRYEYQNNPEPS